MQNQFLKISVLMLVIGGSCFVVWKAHEGLQAAAKKLDVDSFVEIEQPQQASPSAETAVKQASLQPTLARRDPITPLEPTLAEPLPESSFTLIESSSDKTFPAAGEAPARQQTAAEAAPLPDFFATDSVPAMARNVEPSDEGKRELPSQGEESPAADTVASAEQGAPVLPAVSEMAATSQDPFDRFSAASTMPAGQERQLPSLPEPEPLPVAESPKSIPVAKRFGPGAQTLERPVSKEVPGNVEMAGLSRLPDSVAAPVLLPVTALPQEEKPAELQPTPSELTTVSGVMEAPQAADFEKREPASASPRPFLAVGVVNSIPEATPAPLAMPETPAAAPRALEDWSLDAKPVTKTQEPEPMKKEVPKEAVNDWSLEKSAAPAVPVSPFGVQINSAAQGTSAQREMPPLPPAGHDKEESTSGLDQHALPTIVPKGSVEPAKSEPAPAMAVTKSMPNLLPVPEEAVSEPSSVALAAASQSDEIRSRVTPAGMSENEKPQFQGGAEFQTQVVPAANANVANAANDAGNSAGPRAPELKIEKIAPPAAVIGEPIVYAIVIRNVGGSAAQDVIVEDRVPRGTKLDGTIPQGYLNDGKLTWQLGTMAPGEEKKIQLKVTPVESGQIGSVATVSFAAAVSGNMKVTTPQLSISMNGPTEAVLGEQITYQFRLRNQGQDAAKSVFLRAILPPGLRHPGGSDIEYEAGVLNGGAEKVISLTVTPERVGTFVPVAMISSNSKTYGETRSQLNVIRSRLEVSRTGPESRFVNRPAASVIKVTNHSTTPLMNVTIQEKLPPAVEVATLPHGGRWDPKSRLVTWVLPQLAPGETQELSCLYTANAGGVHRGSIVAIDDAGDRVEIPTTLNVKGFADLIADVTSAQRNVLVGERVTFRLTLRNDGSAPAKDVKARFNFPEGFDLLSAHGPCDFTTTGQTVQFGSLADVEVGKEHVYEIALIANVQGTSKVSVALESADYPEPVVRDQPIRVSAN